MSVLMVLESIFPSAGGGGAENQVRTLGRHMRGCGVEVRVLSPRLSWGPQSPTDVVDGIPVRRLTYPRLPMIGAASMLAKLAWTLWRKRHHYDAIHTHIAGNMSAVCSLMGWLLDKPVVVKLTGLTEMSGGILDAGASPGVRVRRRLLMLADAYQATSSRIGRLLVDRGFDAGKVHLIPNAVDTGRFDRVERDGRLRRDLVGDVRLVGIYVGRFDPEKGVELMLQGWAGAFGGRSDAALLLVGSGQLRERLQALAEQLGIAAQVVFAGASEQVERYMAIADFGILASVQEGLSNTLLECMASGLPMVGSQVSGTEDFVRDGQTGWIFPSGDLPALTRCLERMRDASDEEVRRMGQQARQEVGNRASIDAVVTNLLQAYRRPVAAG